MRIAPMPGRGRGAQSASGTLVRCLRASEFRGAGRALRVPTLGSRLVLYLILGLFLAPLAANAAVIDDFTSVSAWSAHPSDGTSLKISQDAGRGGSAMRLDFDFHGGGGYAIARRPLDVDFPESYDFTFWIRAEAPVNNLEFKVIDETGDNVWWLNRRNYSFPAEWTRIRIKKRHLEFAWGPAGGGEIRRSSALEIVVTAGSGGKGTVWIDDLEFHPLKRELPYSGTPVARASSNPRDAKVAIDASSDTFWRSGRASTQTLDVDFGASREFGGLIIDWRNGEYATKYDIELSVDGESWERAYRVDGGNGGRDYIPIPEGEARFVRISMMRRAGRRYAIANVSVEPLEFSSTRNKLYERVAADAKPGRYPKYFSNIQSYWTVVGAPRNESEALINEEGAVEVDQGGFSIEPFLFRPGRLVTWADAKRSQSLAEGDLPIPSVDWDADDVGLTVTAFGDWNAGAPDTSRLVVRYRVQNRARSKQTVTLFLALRPFQVDPPWQFLATNGGVAEIRSLRVDDGVVIANDAKRVIPLTRAEGFGATTFDSGDITEYLGGGSLPDRTAVADSSASASGALKYVLEVPAASAANVVIAVPFRGNAPELHAGLDADAAASFADERLGAVTKQWQDILGRVSVSLPPPVDWFAHAIRSNLAYILINQDGAAIQPGSRSYDRSWIRDGSLTSVALLRLGHAEDVKAFIEWFAPYQYPNGKVPCCVDQRGADPVPENDSHGEFIFLVAEYYRFTHDLDLVRRMWPHVDKAVAYMDELRHQRMTPEYQTPDKRAFYGLLPESISHEGYSAKPMHSYWDDFFALKGFDDAAMLAGALGEKDAAARFGAIRDEFRRDLHSSIALAIAQHAIDHVPGCVELGDFDATSTTIALSPVGDASRLPQDALRNTFDRYWREFVAREKLNNWDGYTPYEFRTVGAMLRLRWPDRARHALEFFRSYARPPAWHEWSEVVYRDPGKAHFIGDMPHTWVGSDFIRSFLDMFAYEDEDDARLIVGSGVAEEWLRGDGVRLSGLQTHFGSIDLTMSGDATSMHATISGTVVPPAGGIVLRAPRAVGHATVNGEPAEVRANEIVVSSVPADVRVNWAK